MTDPTTLRPCPVCKGTGKIDNSKCPFTDIDIDNLNCDGCDICSRETHCPNCDGTGEVTGEQFRDNVRQFNYDYSY